MLSNNKLRKKRIKKNNNIVNTDSNKSENKNKTNLTGKKYKKTKLTNKLISKDIIPFSMSSNNENISELNSLTISSNNILLPNKKLKIYENHLYEYKNISKNKSNGNNIKIKKNNIKNKNNNLNAKVNEHSNMTEDKIKVSYNENLGNINSNSNFISKDNLSDNNGQNNNNSFQQKQTEISNNKYTISSFESSFLNSMKSNIKKGDSNNLIKYFIIWHKKTFYDKIKDKLRSLFLFFKFDNKIKKNKMFIFIQNFKYFYSNILISQIKDLFNKCIIIIIKKSLLKCYMYKIFKKYYEIAYKKKILEKLREYIIQKHKKIISEIHNDIKHLSRASKNIPIYPKNKVIFNNKTQLFININPFIKNNNLLITTNKSMFNLIHSEDNINLKQNDSNKNIYTEYNDIDKKKDIVSQLNQLTMVINLMEHIRIKNIKKNHLSILNYFLKWKKEAINKILKHKNSKLLGEHIIFSDIEDLALTKNTINDNNQSESELASKSDNNNPLGFSLLSNAQKNNTSNKYVPVRGVKCFHGKIKQKIDPFNKNANYKINNLIDKYKTTTISTTTNLNNKTYNNKDGIEIIDNNANDNFRTFNDFNTLQCNNVVINNSNNILKLNNLVQKAKLIEPSKACNSKCIYHRKALGANISICNNKIKNSQNVNDSINTTLDNYGTNFLSLINNPILYGDYKLEPLVLLDDNINNYDINYNIINNKYNKINENYDVENLYGIKKSNKIEEKEVCFISNKINNYNDINKNIKIIKHNKNDNYDNEDISIVREIKKYYNEDNKIYNNDEQKKKFNSFIINIINNTIIMSQKTKTESKRSNSK